MASFSLFCFAFLALISQEILADADVIATTCDKTKFKETCVCDKSKFKELCISIFAAHPESKNADLNGLANIAYDSAIEQAKDIQLKIKELSGSSVDKGTQKPLNECSDLYQQAIDAFDKSKKALESKKYFELSLVALSAAGAGQTCENGLKESSPFGVSPLTALTKMNDTFDNICSIILTITTELAGVKA